MDFRPRSVMVDTRERVGLAAVTAGRCRLYIPDSPLVDLAGIAPDQLHTGTYNSNFIV